MAEQDPSITIRMGETTMELTHHNTTLFTFLGYTALGDMSFENDSINHVFVEMEGTEEGTTSGMYIFERFHPPYKTIANFIIDNQFPVVGNQRTVPECDLRAYMLHVDAEEAKLHDKIQSASVEDFL